MMNTIRLWQLLSVIIAGILGERQQQIIDFLKEENRILRAQIGNRRLRLSDDERRRLAAKGKVLGRRVLGEICCIVTPETILRWHRKLIAIKYDGSANRRPGRPRQPPSIRRRSCDSATAAQPEPERVRRTVQPFDPGGVPRPRDSAGRGPSQGARA